MRSRFTLGLTIALVGCGGSEGEVLNGTSLTDSDAGDGGSTPSGPVIPTTQLLPGTPGLVGVTSDGFAIYRDEAALGAVKLEPGATAAAILEKPGTVMVSRNVVFNWAGMDWATNLGDLSIWSDAGGTQHIGNAVYAETMVSVSEDGSFVVYNANVTEETVDLIVAPNDLSTPKTLIEGMGRGGEKTCPPSLGFVGQRLFVGWCAVGSRAATLDRFDRDGGKWVKTTIATDTLGSFSADAAGERVFYQSGAYQGFFAEGGKSTMVDTSVSGGVMLPDGSALLYNVADQLRRTPLPQVSPTAVVTRGFAQRADFSSGFDYVLYSTTVTYDNGTRRDLFLGKTSEFNPQPVALATTPIASLGRSIFTRSGKFALFLTDVTPNGATLNIHPVDGSAPIKLPNVFEVVAATDNKIVFTDNRSDPEKYPVVADMKMLTLGTGTQPELLEAKVIDGRSFFVDASGHLVVWLRSGVERDRTNPEHQGLFVRSL